MKIGGQPILSGSCLGLLKARYRVLVRAISGSRLRYLKGTSYHFKCVSRVGLGDDVPGGDSPKDEIVTSDLVLIPGRSERVRMTA